VEENIQTPYGEVRAEGSEELQSSFDTRRLLRAVEEIDRFCAQWKKELRDGLLKVHEMAHTVLNRAQLSAAPGEESRPVRRIRSARSSARGGNRSPRPSHCSTNSTDWSPIRGRTVRKPCVFIGLLDVLIGSIMSADHRGAPVVGPRVANSNDTIR
jgi:hypothetical protein